MFSRDKDDDDDFIPNPNNPSNLASIFGSAGSGGENNSSLTYTPPKQPRRQNKPSTIAAPTSSTRSSSLLCAKTVQTFKMVDGAYQNQGKVGAAVLSFSFGSQEGTTYQILLYRDKQNHLCNSRILREFNFHIQPKNYCTFYDKQNTIWSILFDSPADMAEFNLQVAKCRWQAELSTSPILVQDLWCPVQSVEGSASVAAAGDSVDLTYTVSTIDSTSEEVGLSKRVTVQVEASGWKQALVGVQLNTQRVIILQPFMLGDLNPTEVVYNCPVVVKFTVLQVSKAQPSLADEPTIPSVEEFRTQLEVLKREQSLPDIIEQKATESPRSPKSTKVDLINRMARMGQALPFKKTVPRTLSDSDETEEERKSPVHSLSKAVPKPRTRIHLQHSALPLAGDEGESPQVIPSAAQVPVQWATGMQPYMAGNMYPYPVPQISSPSDSHSQFNMFLSEVRTTNSELRMGITRLTDKVDTLHSKVEESKKQPPSLEINSVLEKLMEGEKQLKDQLQQVLTTLQNTQLASQNRAAVEPVAQPTVAPSVSAPDTASAEQCQQCVQLQQTHLALSEKVEKLQQENEVLQVSLTAQKDALSNAKIADKGQLAQIESLQRQLSEEQRNVSELSNSLESLQRVEETLRGDLLTAKHSIAELQDTLQEKQSNIDRLEQGLKDSEATKLEEVRRNLQEVLNPKPVIEEHIKKISNAVYRMVKVQFEPQTKYDANFIQSVLAETIKAVTLQYLQNGNLVSSDQVPAADKGQSVPDAYGQSRSDELKTVYVGQEQHSTSDGECKSSDVTTSSQHSSDGSTVGQSQNSSEQKEGNAGESQVERKSNVLNEKANIVENNTKIGGHPVADTTDDSSDDNQSLISEKLERVLLHIAQSQNKLSDPPLHPSFPSTSSSTPSSWPPCREETQVWRPQPPPPPPLFEDEEAEDDWLS